MLSSAEHERSFLTSGPDKLRYIWYTYQADQAPPLCDLHLSKKTTSSPVKDQSDMKEEQFCDNSWITFLIFS